MHIETDIRKLGKYQIEDKWVRALAIRQPLPGILEQPNPTPLQFQVIGMTIQWNFGMLSSVGVEGISTPEGFERLRNWFNTREVLHVYGCYVPAEHYVDMRILRIGHNGKNVTAFHMVRG